MCWHLCDERMLQDPRCTLLRRTPTRVMHWIVEADAWAVRAWPVGCNVPLASPPRIINS